jgi:hypothetical protein
MFPVASWGWRSIGACRVAVGSSSGDQLLFPSSFTGCGIVAEQSDATLLESIAGGRDDLIPDNNRTADAATWNRSFPCDILAGFAVELFWQIGFAGLTA